MFLTKKKLKKIINEVIGEFIMKTKIYAIKDTVTGNFSQITQSPLDVAIMRDLSNVLKQGDKNNELVVNMKDKALYCLGEYDVDTGLIVPNVKFITNLVDLVEKE